MSNLKEIFESVTDTERLESVRLKFKKIGLLLDEETMNKDLGLKRVERHFWNLISDSSIEKPEVVMSHSDFKIFSDSLGRHLSKLGKDCYLVIQGSHVRARVWVADENKHIAIFSSDSPQLQRHYPEIYDEINAKTTKKRGKSAKGK